MNMAEVVELLRLDAQRAILAHPEQWQKAQARVLLEFMADNGGDCLEHTEKGLATVEERVQLLRSLGYRVVERYEIDSCNPKDPDETEQCCYISHGMWVNLSSPYVGSRCKSKKGRR